MKETKKHHLQFENKQFIAEEGGRSHHKYKPVTITSQIHIMTYFNILEKMLSRAQLFFMDVRNIQCHMLWSLKRQNNQPGGQFDIMSLFLLFSTWEVSRSDRAVANRLTASYSRAVSVLTVTVLEKSPSTLPGQWRSGKCYPDIRSQSLFLEFYIGTDRMLIPTNAPLINQFTENVETEKYN